MNGLLNRVTDPYQTFRVFISACNLCNKFQVSGPQRFEDIVILRINFESKNWCIQLSLKITFMPFESYRSEDLLNKKLFCVNGLIIGRTYVRIDGSTPKVSCVQFALLLTSTTNLKTVASTTLEIF